MQWKLYQENERIEVVPTKWMGTLARKDVDIWAVNILAKLVTIYNSSETGSEILLFQPTKFHKKAFSSLRNSLTKGQS